MKEGNMDLRYRHPGQVAQIIAPYVATLCTTEAKKTIAAGHNRRFAGAIQFAGEREEVKQ